MYTSLFTALSEGATPNSFKRGLIVNTLTTVTTATIITLKTICVANAFLTPSGSFLPTRSAMITLMPAVQPNANCIKIKVIDEVSPTPATSLGLSVCPQIAASVMP